MNFANLGPLLVSRTGPQISVDVPTYNIHIDIDTHPHMIIAFV
jgi:hypothetical protein